ncbi:hypothetical protein [Clostridium perfringens]|uniref:hypothetical protein n=1 Tax=Clostridium perfringens TaxID=1502 RepID=UPI002A2AE4F8|nr:hypothetical protein [Clostridium perfringens]MDM0696511.1 hypothetical protein [Clostridium perfringens]
MYMDCRELIEKIEIEEIINILEHFGAEVKGKTSNSANFTTICHGGDSHSLVYYDNSKQFICYSHSCKNEFGNNHSIITLVQYLESLEFSEAIRWILNFLEDKDITIREKRVRKPYIALEEKEELPIYNKEDLKIYEKNFLWSEWAEEGINYETICKYQIGSYGAKQ